jgi:hypothetical protein
VSPLLLALAVAGVPAGAGPSADRPEPPPAEPAAARASLPDLLARARALRLPEDPGWLRLGHWRPRLLGGWKSQVDGPPFFLAAGGKTDPAAELRATLAALLDPAPREAELDNAACRFPARAAFLAGRLGLPLGTFPARDCPKLSEFLARVQARSATLVFSSYYLNNPASSFGHTFLRLNRTEVPMAGRSFELLDYGVDYSATVDTSNALIYGVKGLFGLFRGQFNHYPYYYKVRQYADYESRDLWEYDLALEPGEVALLVGHLWELGGSWFDYWYLDENCSYHVLGALEAAAPRLDLLSWVRRPVVLPADTVKALFRNPGLVRRVHYRPALRTQFEARARRLSPAALDAVEALAADPAAPVTAAPADEAAALDAAVDLLDLRNPKALVFGTDEAVARPRPALLSRRAGLLVRSPELTVEPPVARSPEAGHGSLRGGLGGGVARTGPGAAARGTALLDLRLCLHDLADPPDGYPETAQIEFLPVRLRVPLGRDARVELDHASFVRVVSLSPMTRFDRRPSWRFDVGAATVRDRGCASCLAGLVTAGGGLALAAGPVDLAAFGDLELLGSARLDGLRGSAWRLGLGPGGLVRLRLGGRAALVATADWRWLPEAAPRRSWGLGLTARLHLARGLSLALDARRAPRDEAVGLTVLLYDRL